MAQKSKLIRNLKPGDVIEVTDATRYPSTHHRVTVRHVQEGPLGFMSNRRTWKAYFEPTLKWGTWCFITGYSDDRVEVYN